MKKLILSILILFISVFAFAEYESIDEINLESADKTLEVLTSRGHSVLINFNEELIAFNDSSSNTLLWHLNNLIEIMNIVDENNIDIDYHSQTAMMYAETYTNRRISFRVLIYSDSSYTARIGIVKYETLQTFYLLRSELENLISLVESAIGRHEDMMSQITLLNEQIKDIY